MHIVLGLKRRPPGNIFARKPEDVHHVTARSGQLRLGEQRQQALVATVAIDDENLLATIARHLFDGLLQKRELRAQAVGNGPRLLLRFKDLSKVVLRENHGILLPHGIHHRETNIDQVGAERKMRTMLLDDPDGKQADSLRLMNGLHEVWRRELLPLGGELVLRNGRQRKGDESEYQSGDGRLGCWHGASEIMKQAILTENPAYSECHASFTQSRCRRPEDPAALSEGARVCPDSPCRHPTASDSEQRLNREDRRATPATASGSETLFQSCAMQRWRLLPM